MEKHAKLIAIKEEMGMCVGVENAQLFSASDLCTCNLVHLYLRRLAHQPAVFLPFCLFLTIPFLPFPTYVYGHEKKYC